MTDAPEQSTRRVLEAIARHLGVDVGQLRGRDRTARVVGARWVAAVLLRERCGMSYPKIGQTLSRSWSSVHDAIRLARTYPRTRELVETVERALIEEQPATRRAVLDIEEHFRELRESRPVANRKPPDPR